MVWHGMAWHGMGKAGTDKEGGPRLDVCPGAQQSLQEPAVEEQTMPEPT